MPNRKPDPRNVRDDEWALVAPPGAPWARRPLALVREDAPQRQHDLREVEGALRWKW